MSAALSLDRLAEINAAVNEYKAASAALKEASKLVPLQEKQHVHVGKPNYDGRFYPENIEVPVATIRALLADRRKLAENRLAAAKRTLAQLNVETPA